MTWKSHLAATAALTLALTGRFEVALAAMVTAALPDQAERFLPLGRHRGASHWLCLWLGIVAAVPRCVQPGVTRWLCTLAVPRGPGSLQPLQAAVGALLVGLALGPLLHVLLDGCSQAGVPVAPFSSRRLKLCLYKTHRRQRGWNVSEALFLGVIFVACACSWRVRHLI